MPNREDYIPKTLLATKEEIGKIIYTELKRQYKGGRLPPFIRISNLAHALSNKIPAPEKVCPVCKGNALVATKPIVSLCKACNGTGKALKEGNKMIDFTQKVEDYLDKFIDHHGCSIKNYDQDRMKWAMTTIAEEVFGYDKLGERLVDVNKTIPKPSQGCGEGMICKRCSKPILKPANVYCFKCRKEIYKEKRRKRYKAERTAINKEKKG
mgnify:CR=1 FL=1